MYVIWDLETMTHTFKDLDSEYGLFNIEINDINDIDEDKEKLVNQLNNLPLTIYGKTYTPSVFLNGDLLCITIDK